MNFGTIFACNNIATIINSDLKFYCRKKGGITIKYFTISTLILAIFLYLTTNGFADCTGNGTNNVVCNTAIPNPFTIQIVTTNGADSVDVQAGSMIDTSATGGTAIRTLNGNDTIDINGDVTGGSAGAPGNDGINSGGGADIVNINGADVTGVDDGIVTEAGTDNITINPGSNIISGDDGILAGSQSDTVTVNGGTITPGTTGNNRDGINMGGGNVADMVEIRGGSVSGGNGNNSEGIVTGGGPDTVILSGGTVSGGSGNNSEAVNTGGQNDSVTVSGATVQGGPAGNSDGIVTDGGADMVVVNSGMVTANDNAIVTGSAPDTVNMTGGMVSGGNNGINAGGGNDTVTVSGGSVDGANNGITTGGGADNISISNADVTGGTNSVQSGGGNDTVTLGNGAMTTGTINGGGGNNDTLIFTQTVPEPECSDLINNIFPTLNPAGDMVTINGITYQWANFESLMPNFICTQPVPRPTERLDVVRGEGCEFITGQGITCGLRCSNLYAPGSVLLLNAIPQEGYEFLEWTGSRSCEGFNSRKTIRMVENMNCMATCGKIVIEEEQAPLGIFVEGDIESVGNINEDFEISLITADENDVFQNLEVELNFPAGFTVNEVAVVNDESEEGESLARSTGEDLCEIIDGNIVRCFIEELINEKIINVNLFVPDLGGQAVDVESTLRTETLPQDTFEEILTIIAGTVSNTNTNNVNGSGNSGGGGCTLVNNSSDRNGLLLLSLMPVAILIWYSRKRKKSIG